nr:GPI mannosyltransferase 3 [Hymenolepis microstoma]
MEVSKRKPKKDKQGPKVEPSQKREIVPTKSKDSSIPKPKKKAKSETGASVLLLMGLIIFRLSNALLIQTTFVPDEIWQSVEVAHRWVYGYGALTWEWEPSVAIRSPLYPLIFAGLYKIMAYFGIDSRNCIVIAPRLFHGFLTGIVEFTIYRMALLLSGKTSAKWVLFAEVTNWFTAYCAPRSLSNSIEWALYAVCLRYYPWPSSLGLNSGSSPGLFMLHVCLCVIFRPTAAVLWGPVCLHYIIRVWFTSSFRNFRRVLGLALLIGVLCMTVSIGVDRWVFHRWTVNQINFLSFNFFSSGADFYGVQPWHWYLTNGLPSILALHLPLFFIGWCVDCSRGCLWLKRKGSKLSSQDIKESTIAKYFGLWILWTVIAYSSLAHKEFRFLFPLFPLFIYYAGRGLLHLNGVFKMSHFSLFRWLIVLLITVNLLLAGYTCTVHQRGPNTLMSVLATQAESAKWERMSKKPDILVLMPCHSTPYLSNLHINISLRLLGCDPDLSLWHNTNSEDYIDEAEYFYEKPTRWLNENYPTSKTLPQYIAMFSELIQNPVYGEAVLNWLTERKYSMCWEIFHAHALWHKSHGREIFVWCAKGWNLDLAEKTREGYGVFKYIMF